VDDGREILEHIVGQLVQVRVDCPRADRRDDHGVPVGGGFRHEAHADACVRAGAIIDDDRLAESLAQLFREKPSLEIRRSPRKVRHDQAYRLDGKGRLPRIHLRVRCGGKCAGAECDQHVHQS
jgi:hypothetical protein